MDTFRQTMVKCEISDLKTGEFVKKEGFEPSYILTGYGKRISRAKIIGTVTNKFMSEDGNYSNMTIEDETSAIRAKAFGESVNIFEEVEIGDIAMLVGKVKEYNGEIYVSPEVVKRTSINFENLHRLEALKGRIAQKGSYDMVKSELNKFSDVEELKKYLTKKQKVDLPEVEGVIESLTKGEQIKEKDHKPFLLELIDKLDKGKGTQIKKLAEEAKLKQSVFEEAMNELITEGLCYEPKPGFVKRV
ncbi:hypothetical protein A3K63_01045 [Candidatus Micrarchaeota archaeon RBG_16_49_10]|nr:MAG: hypothetical protein A3K63_01045 [Candidatus Micrarchaeota archaeon RBG_16_49_10]